jgi:hypothetical protein
MRHDCPFLVQDVLFNSLLAKANRDLAEIARIIGEEHSSHEELAEKTKSAINEKLWDEDPFVVAVDIHYQSDSHMRRAVLKYTVARRWPRVDIAIASVRLRERKESAWPLRSALTQREARQEGNNLAFPNLRWF